MGVWRAVWWRNAVLGCRIEGTKIWRDVCMGCGPSKFQFLWELVWVAWEESPVGKFRLRNLRSILKSPGYLWVSTSMISTPFTSVVISTSMALPTLQLLISSLFHSTSSCHSISLWIFSTASIPENFRAIGVSPWERSRRNNIIKNLQKQIISV